MTHRAVFVMGSEDLLPKIFAPSAMGELRRLTALDRGVVSTTGAAGRAALRDADILIGGWGAPRVSPEDAPRARAVVYAGGVAATLLADVPGWRRRGLRASNARAANAVPVAEFALATILLSGKDVFGAVRRFRRERAPQVREDAPRLIGNRGRVVGLVGLSQVALALIRLLRPFDFEVLAYSPELTEAAAAELGVRRSPLDDVFALSDVVSLHQPLTAQTRGQIDGSLLARMRDGATLINTARGAVVDASALERELASGRIRAVLDVTDPEPLPPGSVLWEAENVVLTPHLAGSMGSELTRIGETCVAEVRRFVEGAPFENPEELT